MSRLEVDEQTLEKLFGTFPELPVVIVIIGNNGAERLWMHEELGTEKQLSWVHKHIMSVANMALKLEDGAGNA